MIDERGDAARRRRSPRRSRRGNRGACRSSACRRRDRARSFTGRPVFARQHRRRAGEERRLALLAAEAAAHAPALHRHVVRAQARARARRGAAPRSGAASSSDQHRAVFLRERRPRSGLRDRNGPGRRSSIDALQPVRRARRGAPCGSPRRRRLGGQHEAAGGERRADVEDARAAARTRRAPARRAPRGVVRRRPRRANSGCPAYCTRPSAKIGSSLSTGAVVVLAGHVRRGERPPRRPARRAPRARSSDRMRPCAMVLMPNAACSVSGRQRHVVDVERLAAHVQVRALVGTRCRRLRPAASAAMFMRHPGEHADAHRLPASQCSR